jgi:iron complex outermembrane recepter protein
LPGAPSHYLRAELLYKHPSGFYVGPNVEWVPQAYFVDSMNTQTTEPYALLGLKAGFDNGGPMSAYIEGRNLTNKTYIASASIIDRATVTSALFEPGTGRAVYAGMRYRW